MDSGSCEASQQHITQQHGIQQQMRAVSRCQLNTDSLLIKISLLCAEIVRQEEEEGIWLELLRESQSLTFGRSRAAQGLQNNVTM